MIKRCLHKRAGALLALALLVPAVATAQTTLNYAFQGDAKSLDPYSLNETFTLSFLGNVYEGLTRRGPDLEIQPALAESWEIIEPTRWRFHLREGVKFHNGNDFTAEDVVFSFERVLAEGSDLTTRVPSDAEIEVVDEHTIDFVLQRPNPILHAEWDTWYIMDKEWAEEHDAVMPTSASGENESYATFNANGTGAFKIVEHEPGVRSVMEANENWWDEPQHNLDRVVFTPISSDATRVAALLSGEIDMMYPVPVQ
ncbi:MAG TPA: ABC transporter substrate-binding protein, partial [Arenicellales bacterium]|nr:ABC transporter substrate-binding protein [Arenicellales bacterium]